MMFLEEKTNVEPGIFFSFWVFPTSLFEMRVYPSARRIALQSPTATIRLCVHSAEGFFNVSRVGDGRATYSFPGLSYLLHLQRLVWFLCLMVSSWVI